MTDELTISKVAVTTVRDMLSDVPNPTAAELVKLLAVQGHILNSIGLTLLAESSNHMKYRDKRAYIQLANECMRESRFALSEALRGMNSREKEPETSG